MLRRAFLIFFCLWPLSALSQGLQVALSDVSSSTTAPIEMSADAMSIDQNAGEAALSGNVLIVQGDMRLSAAEITVRYAETGGSVTEILAQGGVTFVTAMEEVEARSARYLPQENTMSLTGDVLLVQGTTAVSAEAMTLDLASGTAQFEGRVRTVLQPSNP